MTKIKGHEGTPSPGRIARVASLHALEVLLFGDRVVLGLLNPGLVPLE
jgi:hypothetical protein